MADRCIYADFCSWRWSCIFVGVSEGIHGYGLQRLDKGAYGTAKLHVRFLLFIPCHLERHSIIR